MSGPNRATNASTLSIPSFADAQLDIIDSYLSPSNAKEVRTNSRPTSLNSQYSYILVNKANYMANEELDNKDDEWDYCEMSSTKD